MKKAHSLMAAMAVSLVSATAVAGPKFEELERNVPDSATTEPDIYASFVEQLGTDTTAIKAVQADCGLPQTGALATQTQRCMHQHADTLARARHDAAADRAAIEADLGTCRADGTSCTDALAAMTAERDAALASGGAVGAEYGPLEGICAKLDTSQLTGQCDPTSEVIRCTPDETDPLAYTLACVPKRESFLVTKVTPRPDGTSELEYDRTPQDGTLQAAPLSWQVPPQPLPEPPGTCDGGGGVMLCIVLPTAVAIIGGLLIADAASDDFNLVTVRR